MIKIGEDYWVAGTFTSFSTGYLDYTLLKDCTITKHEKKNVPTP